MLQLLFIFSSLLSLWLPQISEASLFEFYSAIPEGCHRCTTKTSNWYLKPDLFTNGDSTFEEFYPCDINQSPIIEDSQDVSPEENMEGSGNMEDGANNIEGLSTENPDLIMKVKKNTCEKTDKRRYHLYRLLKINAILIVVDPPERPHKFDGKREEWSDGPIEGKPLSMIKYMSYVEKINIIIMKVKVFHILLFVYFISFSKRCQQQLFATRSVSKTS